MSHIAGSRLARYGGAVAGVLLATGARLLFDPVLGDRFPFALLFIAILAVAWYGGLGPGMVAVGLGALSSAFFVVPPRERFWGEGWGQGFGMGVYLFVGLVVAWVGGAMQSARRRSELVAEALRESERRFRQLVEGINQVFWMSDLPTTEILYLSPAYEKVWGRSCQSLYDQPRSFLDAILPEDRDRVLAALEMHAKGEPTDVEYRIVRPDGSIRWVRDRGLPVKNEDGRPYRFAGIAEDITERKRAEEALRDSEQRFAGFTQHLPGLAWIKDLQGRYVYANAAAAKAFQVPRDRLHGRTDLEVFPPETAAQFREHDRQALAQGKGVQVIETLMHEDGVLHYSLVSKFPILGPDGKVAFVGGMAIDVTDRLRAEEALKEADRRKDEFLATLAHELRNPLAPIRNALNLIRLAGNNPAALETARSVMDRQVQQMVRLIDDLLDVSRISRNKLDLRCEHTQLAAVVQSAVETSLPLIEGLGHQLEVKLPDEPIFLDGDPTRLAQVFANLLNNAAKFTERGGRMG